MEAHQGTIRIDCPPGGRWSIAETLAQEGHTVVEAGDAMAAVQALTDTPGAIDVVLLDYRLPDSSDLGLLADPRAPGARPTSTQKAAPQ